MSEKTIDKTISKFDWRNTWLVLARFGWDAEKMCPMIRIEAPGWLGQFAKGQLFSAVRLGRITVQFKTPKPDDRVVTWSELKSGAPSPQESEEKRVKRILTRTALTALLILGVGLILLEKCASSMKPSNPSERGFKVGDVVATPIPAISPALAPPSSTSPVRPKSSTIHRRARAGREKRATIDAPAGRVSPDSSEAVEVILVDGRSGAKVKFDCDRENCFKKEAGMSK